MERMGQAVGNHDCCRGKTGNSDLPLTSSQGRLQQSRALPLSPGHLLCMVGGAISSLFPLGRVQILLPAVRQ